MNEYLKDFVKKTFPISGKALDLGAGDFSDVKDLEKLGWQVEGVDLKSGIDLEKPYLSEEAPYDLVYSNYVQHFLTNKENIILSAYNNLKPSGWFFFHDIEYSHLTTKKYLTRKKMEEIIEKCGFKIVKSQHFDYFDKKSDHMHWHVIVEIRAQKPSFDK